MRVFLWVVFIYYLIGYLLMLITVGTSIYPRQINYTKGMDMFRVTVFVTFMVWALILLIKGGC